MRSVLIICLIVALWTPWTFADTDNGVVSVKSAHSVQETADRLESLLKEKGMTVFIRIDHAAGAEKAGMTLRPTELIIFGNPKVGTSLMQCQQSAALDLPQKALIWENEAGDVWLTYNAPQYLAQRHRIESCDEVLKKIENALQNFANAATKP
jgi:uncharacterized protein (DUF302 family)